MEMGATFLWIIEKTGERGRGGDGVRGRATVPPWNLRSKP